MKLRGSRTYRERAAYQREYQRRWRASETGRRINRKIYLKRRVAKSEQRQRKNERGKARIFKSFAELFQDDVDRVSLLPNADVLRDPMFIVWSRGSRRTEFLSDPLPTWKRADGSLAGGLRWNGAEFTAVTDSVTFGLQEHANL